MKHKQAEKARAGGIYIMRIATVLLAVVSWWSTAQGMKNYVFEEKWQANLASLAVQGILLSLNFYLPSFWQDLRSNWKKGIVAALCAVALFCSSWFSYVFIASKAYNQAWDMESQLLVQSTYRTELYDAMDYAEEYQQVLLDELEEQISDLYLKEQMMAKDEDSDASALDLSDDREKYVNDADFKARQVMGVALNALEAVLAPDAAVSDLEQAQTTISAQRTLVEEHLGDLDVQIAQTNADFTVKNQQVKDLKTQLDAAEAAGADAINDLRSAWSTAQSKLSALADKSSEQQGEQADYQRARERLAFYASLLDQASGTGGNQFLASISEIQRELLQGQVDTSNVEEQAISIFRQLQDNESLAMTDAGVYQEMLNEMNSFIRNTQDHSTLKTVAEELDKLAAEMRETPVTAQDGASQDETSVWKDLWSERLETLKLTIGGLPAYTEGTSRSLAGYSRTASMDALDRMLQRYISNHNAADQAIIYLASPYRGMAVFSLLLAFFLDIAAFITGFIIEAVNRKREDEQDDGKADGVTDESDVLPATARHYLYLTGNYTMEAGRYYCQVFDGTVEDEVEMNDPPAAGFFFRDEKGGLQPAEVQDLLFYQMSGGPRDGVYQECCLQYSEHILSIKRSGARDCQFLAAAEADAPVFQVSGNGCLLGAVRDIPPQQWKTAVLALNSKGTRVEAVYLSAQTDV